MKTITKQVGAFALSVAMLSGCGWLGSIGRVSAEETPVTPPHNCKPMELREGNGSDYVDYSTIDGVHLATLEDSTVKSGEIALDLKPTQTDWSNAKYLYVQIESVNHADTLFTSRAVAGNATYFWLKSLQFVQEFGQTGTDQTAAGGLQAVLTAGYKGYAKYELTNPDKIQKFVGNDTELNLGAIYCLEFNFYYSQKNRVNFGDVYIEDESGTTTKVLDASTIKPMEEGKPLAAGQYRINYVTADGLTNEDLAAASRVTTVKANEIKTHSNEKNPWQLWYAEIPTDISAYNGISYYIDNTLGDGKIFFNKCIRETGMNDGVFGFTEVWFVDGTAGTFAQYIPDEGEPSVGNANVIPEGFKGTIVVPFSNFTTRVNTVKDGVLDLSSVWPRLEFAMDVKNSVYTSRDFIMKDVKLVTDARQFHITEQQVTPVGDTKIVNAFEYADEFDLSHDWAIKWEPSAPADLEVIDSPAQDVTGVSGKALKVTCGQRGTAAGSSQDICIQWSLNNKQGNIKGAKGITYWIKNTSYSQMGFRVEFDSLVNGQLQRWQSLQCCRYMLFNTKTGEERMMMGKDKSVYIPAGFEGYVRIEFSQFGLPDWVTVAGELSDDNLVATFFMIANAARHHGDSYIVDSLGWYYSDVELTTTFNTPTNNFTAAMSSDYFAE